MPAPRAKRIRLNLYDVLTLRKELERLQKAVEELVPWKALPTLTVEVENDTVKLEIQLAEALGTLTEMMNMPVVRLAAGLRTANMDEKLEQLVQLAAKMRPCADELQQTLSKPYIQNLQIADDMDDGLTTIDATHAAFTDSLITTLGDPSIAEFYKLCQEFQICAEDAEPKVEQIQKVIKVVEPKLVEFQVSAMWVLKNWVLKSRRAASHAEAVIAKVNSLACQDIRALSDVATCMTRITATDTQLKCCICQENTGNAQACSNELCDHSVCPSCFDGLIMNADCLTKQRGVVNRACVRNECNGTYPQHLIAMMSSGAQDRYIELKANTMMNERIKESFVEEQKEVLQLGQMSFGDREFQFGMKILTRRCGTHCPSCFASFADFQACCALTCSNCKTHFCGLCLTKTRAGENAHAHVTTCPLRRHFNMPDALFIRKEDWIAGRALISNRLLDEYLMTLPSTLTMSTGANVVDELRRTFRKDPTDLPPVTVTTDIVMHEERMDNDALPADDPEEADHERDETSDTTSSMSDYSEDEEEEEADAEARPVVMRR